MNSYTRTAFGKTVQSDFVRRRGRTDVVGASAVQKSAFPVLESRSLGHPDFDALAVGEKRTAPLAVAFLDLTNFTGRSFWDDPGETVDLAHAVLTGFIEVVGNFGGHPLGLRGDGLFAGFSPGDPSFTATMALSACAFALDGVESEVNPWLEARGIARVQARAGLDFGPITFVRTGSQDHSEVNLIGFAANFAAKCEKVANSWEIVVGEGLADQLPDYEHFAEHESSPKRYTRHHESRSYRFYDYQWRRTIQHLVGVPEQLRGRPTSSIIVGR